ncbi:MAG: arginine--tRNA ligase, partial [Bacilli bacterium]|nr:arginine--tRNA ligase [Bacilli bacterium]
MKKLLQQIISEALKKQGIIKESKEIMIEIPKENSNGDYSSNIAMQLTKEYHKNPREIAEFIKENIFSEQIEKIEIAGPGFLNFFV